MGYYCTVPQCTSLAGKTKNVKFHRFPRDTNMADKWNVILKRGKPYTKYSKVCSLHFTQADYNVTTMGQWKTLSKDAVPSQNLPKLHPDGTVMVIRKSRTVKYRDGKKEDSDKTEKWQLPMTHHHTQPLPNTADAQMIHQEHDNNVLAYRLQTLGHMATNIPQHSLPHHLKPKKQDAIMQTDPVQNEDDDTQPNNSYSEVSEKSYSSEVDQYGYHKETDYPMKDEESYPKETYPGEKYPKDSYTGEKYPKETYTGEKYTKDSYAGEKYPKETYTGEKYPKETYTGEKYPKDYKDYPKEGYSKDYEKPKNYSKPDDYIPQTNEEYNKEAEKYALERKSHNGYDLKEIYQKQLQEYPKIPDVYYEKTYARDNYFNNYDSAELLRSQQHNLAILQERQDQGFFNENAIKQEIDITDDDKYMYERTKEQLGANPYNDRRIQQQRLLDHLQQQVKQEPEPNGCEGVIQPQGSPYYQPAIHASAPPGYYDPLSRPGPELLIAKQNALAAHTQL